MASIAHLAAGALCGAAYARATGREPAPAMAAFAALALSPDLDFVAVQMGSNGTALEHRVMTHALPFAVAVGTVTGIWLGRGGGAWWASVLCVLALGSHGVLDAMTRGAAGPQLLWPFSSVPIQTAWQPIPGTQTYQEYFTLAALPVLSVEALVCLPMAIVTVWILLGGRTAEKSQGRGG